MNRLRLLIPEPPEGPSAESFLEISGQRWVLVDALDSNGEQPAPPYTCVSYVWGAGRVPHPFAPELTCSDRALPAIAAVIRAQAPAAIWIDALGVPPEDPARAECMRRLGAIYANADRVAVVLSAPCGAALEQCRTGALDAAALAALDADAWVTRAWTYQEIANSRRLDFVAEDGADVSIDGTDMLNCVGQALVEYRKEHGRDVYQTRRLFPRVDALEDVLVDWRISGALERSAYQVMAALESRLAERPEDYFDAVMGAVSDEARFMDALNDLHPAERFMRLCEAKGDLSFIYSSASRSTEAGRAWRPAVGELRAILPWHTYGDGQSGVVQDTGLLLHEVVSMGRGEISPESVQFIEKWLYKAGSKDGSESLPARVLDRLRGGGFVGVGDCVELTRGYFFSRAAAPYDAGLAVLVATGVRWVHGAAAMLVRTSDDGRHTFRDVGIFVGPVPRTGESIEVESE